MSLSDKRIIVTGAARGIGAAVMRAYADAGARVVGMDTRLQEATAFMTALDRPDRCAFFECDVANSGAVSKAFAQADAFLGGLDVLAAVAGLDKPGRPEELREVDWDLVMNVNAKGTFLTNQAAFSRMRNTGGSIINFGSLAGLRGMRDRPAYSAAKAAVAGWTRAAAQAWGQHGVRVNTIAPLMRTEVAQKYLDRLSPEERAKQAARSVEQIPLDGDLGEPARDLAPFMIFLAGDGARYITGQVFAVDGGMTMLGS